ncbi:hypothetical protein V8G54_018729 [Vigna mungo]|uniref:Aluminum-activated malate transporter n=1 Tax=Vigna mungo TaxID=3915 RepID=A0AAQ3NBB2_VIGMU
MAHPSAAKSHIENAKIAVKELKLVFKTVSLEKAKLRSIMPVVTVASILEEITKSVEKISVAVSGYRVEELIELAHQRFSTILIGCQITYKVSVATGKSRRDDDDPKKETSFEKEDLEEGVSTLQRLP